jgi:hypothetical protein
MFATWRDGAKFPDFALAVELQPDAKAHLVTVMQALKDAFIGPEPEWEQNGEFVTIRLGDGLIAPTYTVAGDFLVLASTPDYARTLRQSRADTLATRLTSGLPANAHEYFYCDIAGLARPLIAQLRLTTPDLPATDGLVRHLTPYRSATVTQPRLETTTTISPFGKPLTVLAGAAGIFAAVKPYLPPLDLGFTATPATTSSNTPTPLPPAENQKATSVE